MTQRWLLLACLLLCPSLAWADEPCLSECAMADCEGCDGAAPCCGPRWEAYAAWINLERNLPGAPLITLDGETLLDTNDFGPSAEAGFEVAVRGPIAGLPAEMRYFQVGDYSDEGLGIFPDNAQFTGDDLGVFTIGLVDYESRLNSFEYNLYLNDPAATTRWLAGFRYFRYDEQFTLNALNIFATDDTENDLFGFQLGVDAELFRPRVWNRLSVRGFAKLGIYYNAAETTYFESDLFLGESMDDSDGAASFVVETGISGAYEVTEWLSIDAGYRLLWLDRVALAGEQLSTTDILVPETNLNFGDALFHGVHVGASLRW